ncbi:NAD(P)/FAD-dependent oxidoreductase [Cellulophaga baltica]|uniref:dihydrolipoyl dehydrogenase family protein n=1 Tax=Cellulophaga TaxID=104264 RepID=UPI001C07343E|nr:MULTISPECIES: NAD(P)/FAD-dependent oxidoreductase [Cellulophaga]MBU2997772.1 NAD(P)/FAD-dependent oxidoreductase [Cellulophaga baltica]MDO6769168.1 NAD(P)/FAD-dependent oxidoreductase [Cellulophaga sp. 1_MG-2023]
MANKKYDVFVIGGGSAGQAVANSCANEGLKVAITEKREYGGTCPLRGCDPKKVLLASTEVLELATDMKGKGVLNIPEFSWKQMQKFKTSFTKPIPSGSIDNLKDNGVDIYEGNASFLTENTLSVGDKIIEASKIVIATGLKPIELPIDGAKYMKTSEDFLSLKKLPKSMVFVGGGYIGMEFAHIAARCGVKVTVIHSHEKPLDGFDPDLVDKLIAYSKELGIKFILDAKVDKVVKGKKKFKVHFNTDNSKAEHVKAKMVFNTAGRVPNIESLAVENGNVTEGKKGLAVNDYLQSTTNKSVYICGDVSDHGLPLTSMTGPESKTVIANIVNGNKTKIDTPVIPSVVYTLPNMASVGYSEEEAKKRYKNVIVNFDIATDWFNAGRINAPLYGFKIIINERTNEIVGAHIVGPHAGETINLFSMAIKMGMTTDDVKEVVFTYPSWSYDLNKML